MRRGLDYILNLRDGTFGRTVSNARGQIGGLDNDLNKLQAGGFNMGSLIKGNLITEGIQRGLGAISSYGADVIKTTASIQGYENAIKFASGSSDEGAESIAFLNQKSNELGVSLESSYKGFKTFQGSLMDSKFSADQVRTMFNQVQMSTAAMNLTAEDSEGVYLALGQVMSKGKVQAEELRGQIGERIPGAFQIAARSMGLTTQELDKMMADGKLMADDFLPKFTAELEKTFGGALPKATQSLQASFNRMDNASLTLKKTLGDALEPAIKSVTNGYTDMLESVTDLIAGKTPLADKILETKIALDAEFEVLKDGNISYEQRLSLIQDINSNAGDYLSNLLTEKSTIEDITKAQMEMNEQLGKKMAIQSKKEVEGKYINKMYDVQKEIMQLNVQAEKYEKADRDKAKKNNSAYSPSRMYNSVLGAIDVKQKEYNRIAMEAQKEGQLYDKVIDDAYGIKRDGNLWNSKAYTDQYVTGRNILMPSEGLMAVMTGKDDKVPAKTDTTTTGSASAGNSVKHITVNVNKLVEQLYYNTSQRINDDSQARRDVGELLLRAVADYEQVAE